MTNLIQPLLRYLFFAFLSLAAAVASAQELNFPAAAPPPLRGGVCWVHDMGGTSFDCDHIGSIKFIREIYERGFRVVATFTGGMGPALIIEEHLNPTPGTRP